MKELRQSAAELIGTFFLCFAGISAILCNQDPINCGSGLVGIALAHGLALSVAVNAFGGLSGAHFNPAVTIGMLATGRIGAGLSIKYIVSQLLGSTIAAFLCRVIFPVAAVDSAKLGIPLPTLPLPPWMSLQTILLVEIILTFLLMTAIFGTAVDARGQAVKIGGFGIGLTVTFDILAGGPITGASMNPARSFGPALVYGDWTYHWCYWAAPIAGSVAAALLYHHLLLKDDTES